MESQHRISYIAIRIITSIYCMCILTLFFCVADQALGHKGLLPTNATILCGILIGPFVLFSSIPQVGGDIRRSPLLGSLWANRLVVTSLMIITLVALLLSILPTAYWGERGKWIAVVPYDATILVCSTALGLSSSAVRQLPRTVFVSLLALAGSIWYDMAHPGTFADMRNRAAGFPGNANFAALTAVVLSSAGLNFGDSRQGFTVKRSLILDALILLTTFTIVAMTMSRSGLVNLSVIVSMFAFFRIFGHQRTARQRVIELFVGACVIGLASAFILWLSATSAATNQNSRLTRLFNNQRVDDGSAGTRLAAVYDSIRLIEEAPLLGHGTGFARTMNELPHNMYLQQWVNNGLLGLGAYLFFLLSSFSTFLLRGHRNGQALVTVAAVGGIFSHNILDLRPFLILMGMHLSHSWLIRQQPDMPAQLSQLRSDPMRFAEPQSASESPVIVR